MDDDEMFEFFRTAGLNPTERTRERWARNRRVQAILDEVRAGLGGESQSWLPDSLIRCEVARLLGPDQEDAMRTWFTLRLTGQIDREYDQIAAAMLLEANLFVESQIHGERPPWLHQRICDFLKARA